MIARAMHGPRKLVGATDISTWRKPEALTHEAPSLIYTTENSKMQESDFPHGVFGRIYRAAVLAKVVERIGASALTRIRKGRHAGRRVVRGRRRAGHR
jgi:hypothetical protein